MTHDTPPKRIWACYDESFDATYWAGPDVVYATDHFVGEYILASEANAMVAAALREAAREVDLRYAEGAMGNPGHYIAPLIPQPASAAFDKLIAEAEARGMERAVGIAHGYWASYRTSADRAYEMDSEEAASTSQRLSAKAEAADAIWNAIRAANGDQP